jgi:hypothetical protein
MHLSSSTETAKEGVEGFGRHRFVPLSHEDMKRRPPARNEARAQLVAHVHRCNEPHHVGRARRIGRPGITHHQGLATIHDAI